MTRYFCFFLGKGPPHWLTASYGAFGLPLMSFAFYREFMSSGFLPAPVTSGDYLGECKTLIQTVFVSDLEEFLLLLSLADGPQEEGHVYHLWGTLWSLYPSHHWECDRESRPLKAKSYIRRISDAYICVRYQSEHLRAALMLPTPRLRGTSLNRLFDVSCWQRISTYEAFIVR